MASQQKETNLRRSPLKKTHEVYGLGSGTNKGRYFSGNECNLSAVKLHSFLTINEMVNNNLYRSFEVNFTEITTAPINRGYHFF